MKLANEATFKRMKDTMQRLHDTSATEFNSLSKILLGISEPTDVVERQDVEFYDETLNDSQKDAVRLSIFAPEIALIHGPPGVFNRSLSILTIDRQNIHTYRNNPPTCLLLSSNLPSRRWPFQHFRRQHLRTTLPSWNPFRPARTSSTASPHGALTLS